MAVRRVVVSDLSGKIVDNPDDVATIRVLDHPLISEPVKLDAFALEVADLKVSKRELVTIEVVLSGQAPERLVMELKDFDALIKSGDPDDVLGGAERYVDQAAAPKRRGRPRGTSTVAKAPPAKPTGSGMDKLQLQAARDWLRAQGHEVNDRGRIKLDLLKLYEDAHAAA